MNIILRRYNLAYSFLNSEFSILLVSKPLGFISHRIWIVYLHTIHKIITLLNNNGKYLLKIELNKTTIALIH